MARLAGFVLGIALIMGGLNQFSRLSRSFEPGAQTTAVAVMTRNAVAIADTTDILPGPINAVTPETVDVSALALQAEVNTFEEPTAGYFEEDVFLPDSAVALTAPKARPDGLPQAVGNLPLPDMQTPLVEPDAPQWQSIWQAFSAQRSAQGFAERLESLTGLTYRVDKLGSGQYGVAFSYRDDDERQQGLSRIEQATGLVLAQGGGDAG